MADINIYVPSFEMEDIYNAFNAQLAQSHAIYLETGEAAYSRLYHDLLKTLRNMERFWDGE